MSDQGLLADSGSGLSMVRSVARGSGRIKEEGSEEGTAGGGGEAARRAARYVWPTFQ